MNDNRAVVEVYSSMECPYAYLMTYRLRQVWPEFRNRVRLVWRSLALEYVNRQSYPKPLAEAEYGLFKLIEPGLPWQPWSRPEWQWPASFWAAFEALQCAQLQGDAAAFELSWALRRAYFEGQRSLSLRHEILAAAEGVAAQGLLDLDRFTADWDSGRCKASVLADSQRGWHELRLEGSATLILPDGRRVTNPATGEIDFDEEHARLRSYTPYPGDPVQVYRELLKSI